MNSEDNSSSSFSMENCPLEYLIYFFILIRQKEIEKNALLSPWEKKRNNK